MRTVHKMKVSTSAGGFGRSLSATALVCAILAVAAVTAKGADVQILQSTTAAKEAEVFWPEMTLVLEGALPNNNPKLGNDLQLTFGRLESTDGVKWREFVLGYSVLYDRGRRVSHYSFRDSEGRLTDVTDDGTRFRLATKSS
jgi:hypothetical protein